LYFKKIGNTRNKDREGITSQKMLVDNSEIFCVLPVSQYSHKIESKDTIGKDANNAPITLLRLEISEMNTINIAEIRTLIM
jgi:hypothetical protein